MNKSYRHGQILKLVRSRSLRTQEELARALRAVGIPATQVTLSRDIRELGLVKTPDGYAQMPKPRPRSRPGDGRCASFCWTCASRKIYWS